MKFTKECLLQFNNLRLTYNSKNILNDISGSISKNQKIGLIGINGSGKTSLLKLLANIIHKNSGEISQNCKIEYVSQLDLEIYKKELLLYEYLGSRYEEWWLVLNMYQELFGKEIRENAKLNTLSGGELIKINISLAFAKSPDLIFLDEPTNHLDLTSIKLLQNLLIKTGVSFVVVSHNIDFLNKVVNRIWELDNGKLFVYGGNYDFYKQAKNRKIQSQQDQYEVVQKKLRKEKSALEKATEKYQKKSSELDKLSRMNDRSMPKIIRNSIKLKVQSNFSSAKHKKFNKISKVKKELESLKIQKRKQVHLNILTDDRTGLLIRITNGKLILSNNTETLKNIHFEIYHKEKIAILGDNGTGKTTFIKQLQYNFHPSLFGEIKYGSEYNTLYIDQKYDLIDKDLTLVENFTKNNRNIKYEDIRQELGNMCFYKEEEINKKSK